jgi:hypothetical protein
VTTYLALDPGLTTGWATYHTARNEFKSGECRGRDVFYEWMEQWGMEICDEPWTNLAPDHVIIERWDVRKDTFGKSAQEDARYIIGAVEWWATQLYGVTYREQRPAEAKRFATNDKLRALGWYEGGEGHSDDAARHLLVALVKDRIPEILETIT